MSTELRGSCSPLRRARRPHTPMAASPGLASHAPLGTGNLPSLHRHLFSRSHPKTLCFSRRYKTDGKHKRSGTERGNVHVLQPAGRRKVTMRGGAESRQNRRHRWHIGPMAAI